MPPETPQKPIQMLLHFCPADNSPTRSAVLLLLLLLLDLEKAQGSKVEQAPAATSVQVPAQLAQGSLILLLSLLFDLATLPSLSLERMQAIHSQVCSSVCQKNALNAITSPNCVHVTVTMCIYVFSLCLFYLGDGYKKG